MSNELILCPGCDKPLKSYKSLPLHLLKSCPGWLARIGVPSSEFNFEAFYKRGLYGDGFVEGEDYVACYICRESSVEFRKRRLIDHLKVKHSLTELDYQKIYPQAPIRLMSTTRRREATTRASYGVDNVFQAESIKAKSRETSMSRYGTENAANSPEVQARRAATNLERYGSENPFGSTCIQEKIRTRNLNTWGFENPNQVPSIIDKRISTNIERYGKEHYFETEEFKARYRNVCLDRYGQVHPMQSKEGKQACFRVIQERYGVDTVFSLPDIQKKAYLSNLANHGGKHSQQDPAILAKARATWIEKYGVDNPSKTLEVKLKIKDIWLAKYGVPFPPQSLWLNQKRTYPNGLESKTHALCPYNVVYTGDWKYPVRSPSTARDRYPDFIVLTDVQLKLYQNGAPLNTLCTTAVIEALGDYWHSEKFTGMSRNAHQQEMVSHYASAGMRCLVIWEQEVNEDPAKVKVGIQEFLLSV